MAENRRVQSVLGPLHLLMLYFLRLFLEYLDLQRASLGHFHVHPGCFQVGWHFEALSLASICDLYLWLEVLSVVLNCLSAFIRPDETILRIRSALAPDPFGERGSRFCMSLAALVTLRVDALHATCCLSCVRTRLCAQGCIDTFISLLNRDALLSDDNV